MGTDPEKTSVSCNITSISISFTFSKREMGTGPEKFFRGRSSHSRRSALAALCSSLAPLRLRPLFARSYGATEAEAVEAAAEAEPVLAAVGGAAVPGVVNPAAPTQDTVIARC